MKKFLFFALITIFSLSTQAIYAAPKPVVARTLTPMFTLAENEKPVGFIVSGKTISFFGTSLGANTTDGFIKAVDETGMTKWESTLDSGVDEIATVAIKNSAGDTWIVGSSAKPLITETATVLPTITALNPDSVTAEAQIPLRNDLTQVIAWKVSSSGQLLQTLTYDMGSPVVVRAAISTDFGIAVVGTYVTDQGNAGFVLQSSLNGFLSKPLSIGKTDTELNALSRNPDNSLIVFGSSTETISGKKLMGLRDGMIANVSATGKLGNVVRSSNSKSIRSWQSSTPSLLLGGEAILAGKTEAVITKFAPNLIPIWTTRFASQTSAMTWDASPNSHLMAFISSSPIAQVAGWKPKKPTTLILNFDGKGSLIGAYGAPSVVMPIAVGFSRDLGVLLLGVSAKGVSIFHSLPR